MNLLEEIQVIISVGVSYSTEKIHGFKHLQINMMAFTGASLVVAMRLIQRRYLLDKLHLHSPSFWCILYMCK